MDRSLQLMHGLALIENPLQFTAKPWIAEQVTQIDRAQEFAERIAAFVGRIALGSRTIQVEYGGGGAPSAVDRGSDPHQGIPAPAGGVAERQPFGDRQQNVRDLDAARHEQFAIAQTGQLGAEFETQQLRQRHREVCETVRVHGSFSSSTCRCRMAPSIAAPAWRRFSTIG